jgi:hypothetical protein
MAQVIFEGDTVEIDAVIIAEALQVSPQQLQAAMRSGSITAVCERGLDEDAGTFRLSFMARNRRLRLIVDETGVVLRRSLLTVADRPTEERLD